MFLRCEFAIQGQDNGIFQVTVFDEFGGRKNFGSTRQEEKKIPLMLCMHFDCFARTRMRHCPVTRIELLVVVLHFDRVVGSGRSYDRYVGRIFFTAESFAQKSRNRRRVDRGGHHENSEIVAKNLLAFEREREREIGFHMALVELVEDHEAHTLEFRVVHNAPRENTFGDHLEPCRCADLAVEAHRIPHRLAGFFTEVVREARGSSTRGYPAWFEHNNLFAFEPGFMQELQRQPGGFARAGVRGENHCG